MREPNELRLKIIPVLRYVVGLNDPYSLRSKLNAIATIFDQPKQH
jgi:hypothetical protein